MSQNMILLKGETLKMSDWGKYQREEREEVAKVTGKLRCVIVDVDEGVPVIAHAQFLHSLRHCIEFFR